MGLFTKDIKSMEDLMMHKLQDIYYAENQITKALPELLDKATNRDLEQALKFCRLKKRRNRSRVWTRCSSCSARSRKVLTAAIDGLIKETDHLMGEVADKQVLDAAIVGSAQAVERCEMRTIRHGHSLGRRVGTRRDRSLSQHQS